MATTPPANRFVPLGAKPLTDAELKYVTELQKQIVKLEEIAKDARGGALDAWSKEKIAMAQVRARVTSSMMTAEATMELAKGNAMAARAAALGKMSEALDQMTDSVNSVGDREVRDKIMASSGMGGAIVRVSQDPALSQTLNQVRDRIRAEGRDGPTQAELQAISDRYSAVADAKFGKAIISSGRKQLAGVSNRAQYALTADAVHDAVVVDMASDVGGDPLLGYAAAQYAQGLRARSDAEWGITDSDRSEVARTRETNAQLWENTWGMVESTMLDGRFSPEAIRNVRETFDMAKQSMLGDPAATAELMSAMPTPAGIDEAAVKINAELARYDNRRDPYISARADLQRAFIERVDPGGDGQLGSKALAMFMAGAHFKGQQGLDKALFYAATNPEKVGQFLDQVRANPGLISDQGQFKRAMKDSGIRTGLLGKLSQTFKRLQPLTTDVIFNQATPQLAESQTAALARGAGYDPEAWVQGAPVDPSEIRVEPATEEPMGIGAQLGASKAVAPQVQPGEAVAQDGDVPGIDFKRVKPREMNVEPIVEPSGIGSAGISFAPGIPDGMKIERIPQDLSGISFAPVAEEEMRAAPVPAPVLQPAADSIVVHPTVGDKVGYFDSAQREARDNPVATDRSLDYIFGRDAKYMYQRTPDGVITVAGMVNPDEEVDWGRIGERINPGDPDYERAMGLITSAAQPKPTSVAPAAPPQPTETIAPERARIQAKPRTREDVIRELEAEMYNRM